MRRKEGKKSFRSWRRRRRAFGCYICTWRRKLQTWKLGRKLWQNLHWHCRERSNSTYAKSFSWLPSRCSSCGDNICRKSFVSTEQKKRLTRDFPRVFLWKAWKGVAFPDKTLCANQGHSHPHEKNCSKSLFGYKDKGSITFEITSLTKTLCFNVLKFSSFFIDC